MKNRCPGTNKRVPYTPGAGPFVTCPDCGRTVHRDGWSSLDNRATVAFHRRPKAGPA